MVRNSTKKIWLFCEGQTEKYYFEQFKAVERIRQISIEVRTSTKNNPTNLIKKAIAFRNFQGRNFYPNDEIWCIFDRDNNSETELKRAVTLASRNNIKLIFSNPCFEYWILCHFENFLSPCEPDDLKQKLDRHMSSYKKGDYEIYSKTMNNLHIAIANSKKAALVHAQNGTLPLTLRHNPSSGVYVLIEYLFSLR